MTWSFYIDGLYKRTGKSYHSFRTFKILEAYRTTELEFMFIEGMPDIKPKMGAYDKNGQQIIECTFRPLDYCIDRAKYFMNEKELQSYVGVLESKQNLKESFFIKA